MSALLDAAEQPDEPAVTAAVSGRRLAFPAGAEARHQVAGRQASAMGRPPLVWEQLAG